MATKIRRRTGQDYAGEVINNIMGLVYIKWNFFNNLIYDKKFCIIKFFIKIFFIDFIGVW
jgi:hypothetical protein